MSEENLIDLVFARDKNSPSFTLETVSPSIANESRINISALMQALITQTNAELADKFLVHQSTVSRLSSSEMIERTGVVLAGLGFVLPKAGVQAVYDIEYVKSLELLAHKNLGSKVAQG